VHGDTVLGVLTRSALVRAMMSQGPEAYVASVMDRNPRRVSPDEELSEILPELTASRSPALVMEGDKLVGLLTAENLSSFILLKQVSQQQQARLQARG